MVRVGILACLATFSTSPCFALERWSMVSSSELIVIARSEGAMWRYPWFDGWHFSGTLVVEEAIRGSVGKGQKLSFKFLCSCCESQFDWRKTRYLMDPGIWFLTHNAAGWWEPVGNCDSIGRRNIGDLPELRQVLLFLSRSGMK